MVFANKREIRMQKEVKYISDRLFLVIIIILLPEKSGGFSPVISCPFKIIPLCLNMGHIRMKKMFNLSKNKNGTLRKGGGGKLKRRVEITNLS